jgi:hypothetical protein
VVELDKALYGCVEAAALWFEDLCATLLADGFVQNAHDACVFNKIGPDGNQITVVAHVDDLMVTSRSESNLECFDQHLRRKYPEVKMHRGLVLNYVGMTFDFRTPGEVRVTMDNCTEDILRTSGATKTKPTPAASTLFDIRPDAVKATVEEAKYFHTHVAKLLYLAKRTRPECLGAVAFLSTRVQACDVDDLAKLRRLHGYILGSRDRGVVLRVGERLGVRAFVDAAYGVHAASGKSHTGCVVMLGERGPVFSKSTKQKIVTKSSTEAELIGLSDSAGQVIHIRSFVEAQGHSTGPAVVYQDNLSTMALMKRGGPGSERTRHIAIRHFWLAEKVENKEVVIQHLSTVDMCANALTKPVQGAQFVRERQLLTNWD